MFRLFPSRHVRRTRIVLDFLAVLFRLCTDLSFLCYSALLWLLLHISFSCCWSSRLFSTISPPGVCPHPHPAQSPQSRAARVVTEATARLPQLVVVLDPPPDQATSMVLPGPPTEVGFKGQLAMTRDYHSSWEQGWWSSTANLTTWNSAQMSRHRPWHTPKQIGNMVATEPSGSEHHE